MFPCHVSRHHHFWKGGDRTRRKQDFPSLNFWRRGNVFLPFPVLFRGRRKESFRTPPLPPHVSEREKGRRRMPAACLPTARRRRPATTHCVKAPSLLVFFHSAFSVRGRARVALVAARRRRGRRGRKVGLSLSPSAFASEWPFPPPFSKALRRKMHFSSSPTLCKKERKKEGNEGGRGGKGGGGDLLPPKLLPPRRVTFDSFPRRKRPPKRAPSFHKNLCEEERANSVGGLDYSPAPSSVLSFIAISPPPCT